MQERGKILCSRLYNTYNNVSPLFHLLDVKIISEPGL